MNRGMRSEAYNLYVNPCDIEFGFQVNGAASPTIFYSKGPYGAAAAALHPAIASIARTGVGTFTVTLADTWPMAVQASCFMQGLITSAAQLNTLNNVGTATPVTATLTTMTSGVAADVAAGANNIVWVYFRFLNTWSQ